MAAKVWYNDNDPFVCAWLRNLISAGFIPAGDVDERPIEQVTGRDVAGYDQCHFFAGIGGWAYALQLAGWGDRPVWTGSCPCQPFSAAGKGQAEDDPRHLWPHWFRLIRECRPERVFGEQVANAAGKGWLDVVSTDLEAEAYTVGAVVLGAHSVGAPHQRQRLWFVADSDSQRREGERLRLQRRGPQQEGAQIDRGCTAASVSEPHGSRLARPTIAAQTAGEPWPPSAGSDWWATEPDVARVAHGIPDLVGKTSGFGNAIVPQVAAAFVSAYMDVLASRDQGEQRP